MWKLNYKESWVPKNWCFWTAMFEKTPESPLDCKEMQPAHSKGNQSWIFIGRTDAEAEAPILWPPEAKNWLIWKYPDAGKDWEQEKGMTEDEMVRVWVSSRSWWWTGKPWRRKWQPNPVFLPGESQGWRSLVGCSLWVAQSPTQLKQLSMHACIGEGNGNPLQCSCLENPRDGEAWWAAIHGVT